MNRRGNAAANESLKINFKGWFRELARKWRVTATDVPDLLGRGWAEVDNRSVQYPRIGELLRSPRLDMDEIGRLLAGCYPLMGHFDAIRLNRFLNDHRSTSAVAKLVREFPRKDREAVRRINGFVNRAVALGFKGPTGTGDYSGAALLASVLLTSLAPERFVEFRNIRWAKMASSLGHPFRKADTYGEQIVQASRFGRAVCRTADFRRNWPHQVPLWVLAGICWVGSRGDRPQAPAPLKIDVVVDDDRAFPEGGRKEIMHRRHERNRVVVKLAKERGLRQDRSLPCEVCGLPPKMIPTPILAFSQLLLPAA